MYTSEEALSHMEEPQPGPGMDAAVAERVMEWTPGKLPSGEFAWVDGGLPVGNGTFSPSTDLGDAMKVAHLFANRDGAFLHLEQLGLWAWRAKLGTLASGTGDLPSAAICRAALATLR